MKKFGPLSRALALAGFVVAGNVAPAFAAKADLDLLAAYVGTWSGTGSLQGAQAEPVKCRMTLAGGNGTKINYAGRCSIAGQNLSVNGTIAYNDGAKQYEAAMSTGFGGFDSTAVGRKSGDNIVFNLKQRGSDDAGNDITISAVVTLAKATKKITVEFHAVFNKTGDTLDAAIPFSME